MIRSDTLRLDAPTPGLAKLEAWGLARCPLAELNRLEPFVEQLSKSFTDTRPDTFSTYLNEPDLLTAYALFFAPQTYVRTREALQGIFARLKTRATSRRAPRILDIGCGIGSAALAAADLLSETSGIAPEVTLVDWSEGALQAAQELLPGCHTIRANVRDFTPDPSAYDLILSSFAFNEIFTSTAEAATTLRAWSNGLSEEAPFPAFLLLLEPASRETTPRFLSLRERLPELPLYAPCPHRRACPMIATESGICHDVRKFKPSRAMVLLNRHLFRTISDVKYALLAFGRPNGPEAEGMHEAEFVRLVGPMDKGKGTLQCRVCMGDGALRRLVLPAAALNSERRHLLLSRQRGDCAWLDGPLEGRRLLEAGKVQRTADLRFTDEPPPELDEGLEDFSFSI